MSKVVIEVTGEDTDLGTFIEFLKTAQHLCRVGASRKLEMIVDGDGSAALAFTFGETDTTGVKPRDPDSDLKFYIGE